MKKSILICFILFMTSALLLAQEKYSRSDIFKVNIITWMGIDFSMIKLIGGYEDFADPEYIKTSYFMGINNLVLSEPGKFKLTSFFHKQEVDHDLSVIRERNKLPEIEELMLDPGGTYQLNEADIKEVIDEYLPKSSSGIGVVFIIESFNKQQEIGYMWVTFFDIASKKVLLTERMYGKARGFGWRNYWAHTVYQVMKKIKREQYYAWQDI